MLTRVALATLILALSHTVGRVDAQTAKVPPTARAHFDRGLTWLHNFGYDEAVDEFQKARGIDPTFVLAYWGEAMCHYRPVWHIENVAAGRDALARLGASAEQRLAKAANARERSYLEAADALFNSLQDQQRRHSAFAEAMRQIANQYPDDLDAAIFYAFALIGTVPVGVYDDKRLDEAGAAAERVLARNSKHPGAAHAVIHAYDDRERAPRALPAATAYAKLAPESSHALHMPAHIFVQLGMWDEAVASDERAWSVAVAHAKRRGLSLAERDFHPLSWLVYEYVQQGRFDRARDALVPLREALAADARPALINELATWRAYYVVGSERWREIEHRQKFDNADELFALGYAAALTGQFDKARAARDVMAKIAATDAIPSRRELAAIMELQLAAAVSAGSKALPAALEAARAAALLEDKTPRSPGRPHPVKPSHELYGELLLQANRPAEAKVQFERALWRAANRSSSVLGLARAAAAAGDQPAARAHYAQFLRNWRLADQTRPEIAEARRFAR